MPFFTIATKWQVRKSFIVEAATEEEAIDRLEGAVALSEEESKFPNNNFDTLQVIGDYVDDTFEIDTDIEIDVQY